MYYCAFFVNCIRCLAMTVINDFWINQSIKTHLCSDMLQTN